MVSDHLDLYAELTAGLKAVQIISILTPPPDQDTDAADHVIRWITESPDEPLFIFAEFASTHWTYYFDEDHALIRPFAKAVQPHLLNTQPEFDLLKNRYLNAMHQILLDLIFIPRVGMDDVPMASIIGMKLGLG